MKNRFLAILIIVAMVFAAIPTVMAAVSDSQGNGWHYNFSTGTLTVTTNEGTTAWKDTWTNALIYSNDVVSPHDIKNIIIGDKVTEIGDYAFSQVNITEITIPNSVTRIGRSAFNSCNNLTEVIIPDSVTYIGEWAFTFCQNLTEITIPNSVTRIGYEAFSGCTALTQINAAQKRENLDYEKDFSYYYAVDGVLFSESNHVVLSDIDVQVYYNHFLVAYPVGRTDSHYAIPDEVTYISDEAFAYSKHLTSVTIPDSITHIGRAFAHCVALTEVSIPAKVSMVARTAFYGCTSLININVSPDNERYYYSIDGVLFYGIAERNDMRLVQYPPGRTDSVYVVPEGVTQILRSAFAYSSSLTEVIFPASVSRIEEQPFYECTSLTSLTFKGSAPPQVEFFDIWVYNAPLLATLYVPFGAMAEYRMVLEFIVYDIIPLVFVPDPCDNCSMCEGGRFKAGHILGNEELTILDVLEVLKSIVGIDSAVDKCGYALYAALIVDERPVENKPIIFDVLEMLKHLVGMPSVIDVIMSRFTECGYFGGRDQCLCGLCW